MAHYKQGKDKQGELDAFIPKAQNNTKETIMIKNSSAPININELLFRVL